MSNFCRGCSRELPKDRKGYEQYCHYCIEGMKFVSKGLLPCGLPEPISDCIAYCDKQTAKCRKKKWK